MDEADILIEELCRDKVRKHLFFTFYFFNKRCMLYVKQKNYFSVLGMPQFLVYIDMMLANCRHCVAAFSASTESTSHCLPTGSSVEKEWNVHCSHGLLWIRQQWRHQETTARGRKWNLLINDMKIVLYTEVFFSTLLVKVSD